MRGRIVPIGLGLALLFAAAASSSDAARRSEARTSRAGSSLTAVYQAMARQQDQSRASPSPQSASEHPGGTEVSRPVESERVRGSFIVDLAPGLDPHEDSRQVAADYGGEVATVYDEVVGGFAFTGPDDALQRMRRDPRVRSVDNDYVARLATHSIPTERIAIRAPEAWTISNGAGAVVAILDTGVNASNSRLNGGILGSDGSCVGDPSGSDGSGHGTAVAGHVLGHYGTAPAARAYMVKIFPTGSQTTSYANIICGLNLVKSWVPSTTIHAANISVSGTAYSETLGKAVRELRDAGVVVVAAAGNSGGSVQYPAAFSEAVAVSALDRTNVKVASFSSRGPEIDIGAPGDKLQTLTLSDCCKTGSGTSFAAPQVTAAAAVIKALNPSMSVDEVEARLLSTGFCPPGVTPNTNADGGLCDTEARSGDNDGYPEAALNLEGAVKGLDLSVASIPGPATLRSPSGTGTASSPTFSWDDVSDSTWYYLWIDGPGGTLLNKWYTAGVLGCESGTCSVNPGLELSAGSHTWWVQTWNNGGEGPWSAAKSFSVDPPGRATLNGPSGTASSSPTFSWNPVSGSTSYYLWINGPNGKVLDRWYTSVQVGCGGGASPCQINPGLSLTSGSYTWWIQTWNDSGFGPWSAEKNFTVP